MNLPARYKVDISQPVQPTPLMQMLICQDSQANRFIVDVYDGDAAVALTGSCVGYAVRADGATVPMTGAVSGSSMAVVLPEEAYAVEGPINIVIKNVVGDVRTTVFFGMGTVIIGQTGTVVNPGDVIPDLPALLAAIDQMEQATAAANAAAASAQRYTGGVSLSFELGDFYVDSGGTGTYYNSTIRMRTPQGTTVALKAGDVAQFADPTGRQFRIYAEDATSGTYTDITGGWISGPFTVRSAADAVILLRYTGEPEITNPDDLSGGFQIWHAASDHLKFEKLENATDASIQRYTGGVPLSFELGDFYVDAGGAGTYYNSTIRMRTPQGTTVTLKAGDVAQFVDPAGRQFLIYAKNADTGLYTGISGGWISGPFTVPSDTEAVILLRYVGEPTISDPDDLSAGFQIWHASSDHLRFSERFADVEEEINDLRNSAIFYRDADGYVCEY